ncbi:uncharacterized protein LOC107362652 [Tetranychus urticae]|uniref:Fucolectin tachylectin-4 pentraxin-1 domain-containing protein n=1 Tax=Tetranychus urticae TaxID=32264 RepID=T1KCN3_TETUR|nr:uncharacterized protein LOC107362652 [Tetranychus urticae]
MQSVKAIDIMFSLFIYFQLIVPIVIGTISVNYVHQLNDFIGSYERGSVLNCATECAQIPDCTCVRLSINGSDVCEPLLTEMDANGLNHTDFVYFAMILPNFTQENLALKKPATQSSVFEVNGISYTADRAVDGSQNIETFKLPYLSQTKDGNEADSFPWWQVDLKREYIVSMVKILNRKNPADRLHDFEVRVGHKSITTDYNNVQFNSNGLCGGHKGAGIESGQMVTIKCEPCPLAGRFVTIQIVKNCDDCREKDKNILNLAEVEVYGSPLLVNEKKEEKDSKGKGKGQKKASSAEDDDSTDGKDD